MQALPTGRLKGRNGVQPKGAKPAPRKGEHMAVFKKQGVYWIDYYVSGRRKRERIGPDKRLAETVLKKRQVAIAEGKYLDKTPGAAVHVR